MSTKTLLLSASVAALGLAPFAVAAAPISSEAAITVATGFSGSAAQATTTTDTAVPGDATDGTAESGSSTFGNYALQQSNGNSEVNAESFRGGNADFEMVTSQALLNQLEVNTSNATRRYFLDFTLQGLSADLQHATDQIEGPEIVARAALSGGIPTSGTTVTTATASEPLPAEGTELTAVNPFGDTTVDINASSVTAASFEYFIEVNGQTVFSTRADAMVSFEAGEQIVSDGLFGDSAALSGSFGSGFSFDIDPITNQVIELGDFAAGSEIEVRSGLIARAYSHAGFGFGGSENCEVESNDDFPCFTFFSNGVDSFFSDPVLISSIGFKTLNTTAVPLPAAGWLLIAGLGGMAALGRRRKTS